MLAVLVIGSAIAALISLALPLPEEFKVLVGVIGIVLVFCSLLFIPVVLKLIVLVTLVISKQRDIWNSGGYL